MGREAPDYLIKLIKGEAVEDPVYTGLDECTLAVLEHQLHNRVGIQHAMTTGSTPAVRGSPLRPAALHIIATTP